MNKEKKIMPELRFPEFVKEGEWSNEELGQISEIVRGGSPRPIQEYLTKDVNGLNWLKIADVPSDSKYITETKEKVINEALSSTREVNPGDLILSNSMSFGRPYILKIKTCIHDGWIAIRKISNKTYEDYLYYFISSENSQSYFKTNAAGAAVKNLNADIIKLLPIYLPKNKNEQQKIASCLSSLDELLAAHNEKLEALKDHKKGLMQNLFPQMSGTGLLRLKDEQDKNEILSVSSSYKSCSDNLPKFRFPEFEKDGEWVEKTVGDVYNFKITNSFSREYLNYDKGKVKNIHYGDIHRKFNTLFDITKENVPFINQDISIEKINKESYCIEGDIVFADASEDLDDVGKSIEIVNLNNEKLVSGLHTLLARQRKNNVAIGFGGYLFKSDWIRKQIQREAQGAKVLGISANRISNVKIYYPKDSKEQQKIASCLSSLDALIMAQAEKIEQLQEHKKGLMQGLFP
ncbi:MAG: restriction endonuclease subunit S [Prolixibacteraceae bacterium]|nr:restriction endonuclease subunit S [Prolixibacteraceae bacterium]MBN2648198.1 restriction endonuclease subunit S [Prolixibacteraceae bacterium]